MTPKQKVMIRLDDETYSKFVEIAEANRWSLNITGVAAITEFIENNYGFKTSVLENKSQNKMNLKFQRLNNLIKNMTARIEALEGEVRELKEGV